MKANDSVIKTTLLVGILCITINLLTFTLQSHFANIALEYK
jgi:hypothetical protein